jgi:hypothetical protein
MKSKILLLFILISSYAFSQSVNDYQYVIVPVKYDFLSKEDQYGLNTLTKLLLQKYGFKAYLSNEEIPLNTDKQRCNFLYADVIQDKSLFVTKVKVALKDCKEKVVFETQFGSSREKEFAVAFNQAFRESGKSFDKLKYKYKEGNNSKMVSQEVTTATSQNTSIDTIKKESNQTQELYFAQPIANGYQIVDMEPKIIMKLFNTSEKNVFIAQKENKTGLVIYINGQWFFEYYDGDKLVSESWNLRF